MQSISSLGVKACLGVGLSGSLGAWQDLDLLQLGSAAMAAVRRT